MRKKFVSSLALLLSLNFLIKPLWIFGIDITVQNRVGPENYGLYAAIFSFTIIFNIVLDLGLSHYNNRSIARRPSEIVKSLSYLTTLKFLLGIVYLIFTLSIGMALNYRGYAFNLLLILSINQFLSSLVLFLRSNLAGLQLFKADALMSVLDKLLMIITCGILLYTSWLDLEFDITVFALAQTVSYLITCTIGFLWTASKARIFNPRFDLRDFTKRLRQSLPYALLILLMSLYTKVDSVMIQQISGAFENGIYTQAFRLLESVNQVGYLFSALLLPMYSGMIARDESVGELTRLAFSILLALITAVAVGGFFFANPIMSTLYDVHSNLSAPIFRLLIVSSLAFAATYIFGTFLTARGNLKLLNRVAASGFFLNIVLNALLIPRYGATGAAYATVGTQFATAIIQTYLSFRLARIEIRGRYWLQLLVFIGLSAGLGFAAQEFSGLRWYWNFIGLLVAVPSLALVLRLISLKPALYFLRQRFAASD